MKGNINPHPHTPNRDWCDDKFDNFGHLHSKKIRKLSGKFNYKDFNNLADYWIKYEGNFKMDKKNGFGILYLTNGEKYSGTFVNDTVDGYGLFYQLEGQPVSG